MPAKRRRACCLPGGCGASTRWTPLAGQVTAGAGVTIAELRAHAAAAGLEYGVDLASRESATVGGTIATNAGGVHTIRYGGTRAQLLGRGGRAGRRPA